MNAATTTTDRIIITLTADEAKALCGRGEYKKMVLFNGHIPGHLTGARLARRIHAGSGAAKYTTQRNDLLIDVYARHGVIAAPIAAHHGVVWAKEVSPGVLVPVEFVGAFTS